MCLRLQTVKEGSGKHIPLTNALNSQFRRETFDLFNRAQDSVPLEGT